MTDDPTPGSFRLALVPGMVPTSWTRTWRDRLPDVRLDLLHPAAQDAPATVLDGDADAALLRLPVDRDRLHAIPLFTEVTVVVLPKDHLLTALEEVTADDLAEETLLVPADDVLHWSDPPGETSALPTPATTGEAVELVAAGVGLLAVPMSLARLHHRRDLTYRPLPGAPSSQAALAWSRDREDDPLIEELIGIVRGRTANSSRGRGRTTPAAPAPRDGAGRASGGTKSAGGQAGPRGGRRPTGSSGGKSRRTGRRRGGRGH